MKNHQNLAEGTKVEPKSPKSSPTWASRPPKWCQKGPNGSRKRPKGPQLEPQGRQKEPKGEPRAANGSQKGAKSELRGDQNASKNRSSEKVAKREPKWSYHLMLFGFVLEPFSIKKRWTNRCENRCLKSKEISWKINAKMKLILGVF